MFLNIECILKEFLEIERAIAQHSEHSQGVMQLATIIADNVKKLPNPTS